MEDTTHLDHALAGEFSSHIDTIHKLKIENAHFRKLMEENHKLWLEIKNIQNNVTPADDTVLNVLEKKRLALLDEMEVFIEKAEK